MSKVVAFTGQTQYADKGVEKAEEQSTAGENALRTMCHTLTSDENRKRFKAFPEGYCRNFNLTLEQIHAVTDLDMLRILRLGGDRECLENLFVIYGLSVLELGAQQTGKSPDEIDALLRNY